MGTADQPLVVQSRILSMLSMIGNTA